MPQSCWLLLQTEQYNQELACYNDRKSKRPVWLFSHQSEIDLNWTTLKEAKSFQKRIQIVKYARPSSSISTGNYTLKPLNNQGMLFHKVGFCGFFFCCCFGFFFKAWQNPMNISYSKKVLLVVLFLLYDSIMLLYHHWTIQLDPPPGMAHGMSSLSYIYWERLHYGWLFMASLRRIWNRKCQYETSWQRREN